MADKDGYNLCELTLDHLDDEFDRLLRNQGALTVWTCVRNLSPVYWVSASDSHAQVRRIAEKAIERHSKWRAGDRLVPTSWSDSEARVAGRCLAIAEAYNNLLVARRRIAKGQTARVVDWSPLRMEFTDNEGLDRLIDVRDRRVAADDNPLSSLASTAPPVLHPRTHRKPTRVTASYADPQALRHDVNASQLVTSAPTSFGVQVARADIVTDWADTPNAAELERLFVPYDETLRRELGYTMIDLLAVNSLVTLALFPRFGTGPNIPSSLEFCGYAMIPRNAIDFDRAPAAARGVGISAWNDITSTSAAAAFQALTKDRSHTEPRTLARAPIAIVGDHLFIDFVGFDLEYHLANHLASRDYFEQRNPGDFETRVHAALAPLGAQPIGPGQNVYLETTHLTDIDASVLIDETFIAVDCYASPWRDDLDQGIFNATRSRMANLRQKLVDWDAKMVALAGSQLNWLRESGATQVLPVVVSATPEWIDNRDPRVWFDADLPRICTVQELIDRVAADRSLWVPHLISIR